MRLQGRLFISNKTTDIKEVTYSDDSVPFSVELERALILLCRELDIPAPMWMAKNTKEFAAFRQTIFFSEQYVEKVRFDKFQIKQLE
ncbi:MAG: hypothetical protein J5685_00225 [Clostridiales bacterium]|nr:hypothetical protein [Clostridiales bacterium]